MLTNESRLVYSLISLQHQSIKMLNFRSNSFDYPLIEAIHQNIVKNIEVPKKIYRDELQVFLQQSFQRNGDSLLIWVILNGKKVIGVSRDR